MRAVLKVNNSTVMIRTIFSKLCFYSLYTGISFFPLMNASQCRSEQHEGWTWARSLRYHTEFEDLDFQPIHQELDSYHTQLAGLLNLTGRNLCTAQIHLIVEPVAGGQLQLITSPGRINLQNKIPLTKHVFISGSEKPEGKGTGFKFITEVERENEPKKWTPKK